jgi:hypothetical protein
VVVSVAIDAAAVVAVLGSYVLHKTFFAVFGVGLFRAGFSAFPATRVDRLAGSGIVTDFPALAALVGTGLFLPPVDSNYGAEHEEGFRKKGWEDGVVFVYEREGYGGYGLVADVFGLLNPLGWVGDCDVFQDAVFLDRVCEVLVRTENEVVVFGWDSVGDDPDPRDVAGNDDIWMIRGEELGYRVFVVFNGGDAGGVGEDDYVVSVGFADCSCDGGFGLGDR